MLSQVEYARLKAAAAEDPRGRAIIEVFVRTGIRLSELARLRVKDVALPDSDHTSAIGSVQIWGRGRKQRTITLNSKACAALCLPPDARQTRTRRYSSRSMSRR